ncbi:MAG: S8 family peptidase [Bacteroidia bacterium]|nr:S8 family peptidase [Bacteroidia bacterium]
MKYLILSAMVFASTTLFAQKNKKTKSPAQDWYQQGMQKSNMGIDLYKAYESLPANAPAKDIIVAVIDGGTDINHPDLKANLWHNPGEIPFNGIDDDHNGYTDDTVGWNFIGGADGKMVEFDNLEKTRILRTLMKKYSEMDASDINDPVKRAEYEHYQKLKTDVEQNRLTYLGLLTAQLEPAIKALDDMRESMGKTNPSREDLEKYNPTDPQNIALKSILLKALEKDGITFEAIYEQIREPYDQVYAMAHYHYNTDYDPRSIVGDNYENASERYYGNNNVAGGDPFHGTHVAGIIGAVRNNGLGVNGVADHVKIMVVRVVPNGDERDKDVANGIRYAVDNGARILNMSFGKSYKWNKAVVDSAVAYAVSKGVLLVHAAGNDNQNNDLDANYPNDSLGNGQFASTWLEIGASAPEKKKLATDFSNYGQHNVDLFSPGYKIYSTAPGTIYKFSDGTSMAAPVASGVAALVWSRYPNLTAEQLKEILMKSSVVNKKKVVLPGTKSTKIRFTRLSVSGGLINADRALKLAAATSGK